MLSIAFYQTPLNELLTGINLLSRLHLEAGHMMQCPQPCPLMAPFRLEPNWNMGVGRFLGQTSYTQN